MTTLYITKTKAKTTLIKFISENKLLEDLMDSLLVHYGYNCIVVDNNSINDNDILDKLDPEILIGEF